MATNNQRPPGDPGALTRSLLVPLRFVDQATLRRKGYVIPFGVCFAAAAGLFWSMSRRT